MSERVDVGELVERASVVGWRCEGKWECAWGAIVTATTGGFGCTGLAWYTLVDVLRRGLRRGGGDWPSIRV